MSVDTVEAVQAAVVTAHERHEALYPSGSGTKLYLGLTPTKPGHILELRQLNRLIDYPARDMTITAEAGMTLGELGKVLNQEGQELPIDGPAEATIGGMLATNTSGPRRTSRGTLRDYLIGISFVSDEGKVIHGGGRVVKNVAGYDLMKLQTGAMGTLGIITQATFKVIPKPETRAFLSFSVSGAALGPTLDRLHGSSSRPAILELLNSRSARSLGIETSDAWALVLGFEEKRVTVAKQIATLQAELKGSPVRDVRTVTDVEADVLLTKLTAHLADAPERMTGKANLLPSQVAAYCQLAESLHPESEIHAHPHVGVVMVSYSVDFPRERAVQMVSELTPKTPGGFVVRRAPSEWKPMLMKTPPDAILADMVRQLKATLDPQDLFNPGRWVY
ncbi:MAG: FAD-binding oxidoreductase [Fimbriiglobus sp.]